MKKLTSAGAVFIVLLFASATLAQQPSGAAATTAATTATPPLLPKGKIAVIDPSGFQDQIDEFKEKVADLNRQLDSRNKEVRDLADKIIALENTLQMQRQILSASRVAEMTGNLDTMKREYQRKGTDLREYAAKEQARAFEPLFAKLKTFADEYSAKRNIVLLVDLGSALQSRALLWHSENIDMTKDFVAEYNKENPANSPVKK